MHTAVEAARSGLIDLNGTGHYLQWGVIQISIANLTVIALMIVVFVLALVVPFHNGAAEHPVADSATGGAGPEVTDEVTQ